MSTNDRIGGQENEAFEPCILIPTYNNVRTIESVVRAALETGLQVFVVDDGATDGTGEALDAIEGIRLERHEVNRGKGAALLTGFEAAREAGFTHAITIDSDGQHDPTLVPEFVAAAREWPGALILGDRDLESAGAGRGSLWGRRNSNFWTWVETGVRLPDTQTGYRVYPLDEVLARYFKTTGFDFEIEVLVKCSWAGVELRSIPIPVRYFSGEERVSHMKPLRDFLRIARLNNRLVAARLCLPPPFLELASRREFQAQPRGERWRDALHEIFVREPGSSLRVGTSAGFGLFMGLTPLWGYQIILTLFLCHRLRLSKSVAVLAAHISLPPFMPFIIYGSLVFGRMLLGGDAGEPSTSLEIGSGDFVPWIIGSFALATIVGLAGGLLAYVSVAAARHLRSGSGES